MPSAHRGPNEDRRAAIERIQGHERRSPSTASLAPQRALWPWTMEAGVVLLEPNPGAAWMAKAEEVSATV